uniref:Uncharacterized protein n=1 Tax=Arundo donax TaxID=35708 RepID=A0A0A8YVY2_ARUDO
MTSYPPLLTGRLRRLNACTATRFSTAAEPMALAAC